jgi:hypothetical protein
MILVRALAMDFFLLATLLLTIEAEMNTLFAKEMEGNGRQGYDQ